MPLRSRLRARRRPGGSREETTRPTPLLSLNSGLIRDQRGKLTAVHFAGFAVRDVVDDDQPLGCLEVSDQVAAVRPEFLERYGHTRDNRYSHTLTHFLIGDPGNCHVAHRGMCAQRLFDLDRTKLLTASIDGVLQPTAWVDVAIRILAREIAGAQPAVDHVLLTAHPQLADGAYGDIDPGVGVHNADLHSRQCSTN